MDCSALFQPGRIGRMELKNRLVMSAMGTGFATGSGEVTERLIDYYIERAKGGVGLITVECTIVTPEGLYGISVPTELRAYNHRYIPGLNLVVEAIHRNGAKAALQLNSPGGLIDPAIEEGVMPVTASPMIANGLVATYSTREATLEDIEILQKAYADAAYRARMAGFDAVELHCSHGYVICSFQSAYTNKRTDAYGGSFENRMRMGVETIQRMREKVGPDFPIIVRIPAEEYVPNGIDIEESIKMAKMYINAGADAINLTSCTLDSPMSKWCGGSWPQYAPRGLLISHAAKMKAAVNVPVMVVGGLDYPEYSVPVIEEGKADFIEIGRSLITDPDLPNKLKEGRVEDVRYCIRCNELCLGRVLNYRSIGCSVNPLVGREGRYRLTKGLRSKKVVIVGAGPAGAQAAIMAKMRGHQVVLLEKSDRIGGNLVPASMPEFKVEERRLINWLARQIQQLDIEVRFNQEATAEMVLQEAPDVAIIATGAVPIKPDIPGVEKGVDAIDLLLGRVQVADPIVIIGGGLVGCETALHLAFQGYNRIIILEMLDDILLGINSITKYGLIERLQEQGVSWYTGLKVTSITDSGVLAMDRNWRQHSFPGTAVIAVGLKPYNTGLKEALAGRVPEVYLVGDCAQPRKIWNSIHEAFEVANKI